MFAFTRVTTCTTATPRLRTVISKVGSIDSGGNEFRVPEWELLAGDTSLETEVRQHGIPFKLDFGEVYWNSRLEAEHKRVIDLIKPGEILCDAMAGIGPFAVPAAK
jgi:tRNA (guanine37-N1)-methyltransferase